MSWRTFQAKQRVVDVGDRFVSYVDEGSGPPVILLHGMPTWGYVWHRMIPGLARTHRVLAPDLVGFGYSDKSDQFDRSIARQAGLVDGWMDRIGVERAAFVGHDIGGGVALRLAALLPRRVSRLCLMNTVCYDSWPIQLLLELGHPRVLRRLGPRAVWKLVRHAVEQGFAGSPSDALIEGLIAPYETEVGARSLVRNAAALDTNHTTEIVPFLRNLEAPTLVLWGADDAFARPHYGERLVWDIPNARLVRVPDARHFVMLDDPVVCARELHAFLHEDALAP